MPLRSFLIAILLLSSTAEATEAATALDAACRLVPRLDRTKEGSAQLIAKLTSAGVWDQLAGVTLDGWGTVLRRAAAKEGIPTCPLADHYDRLDFPIPPDDSCVLQRGYCVIDAANEDRVDEILAFPKREQLLVVFRVTPDDVSPLKHLSKMPWLRRVGILGNDAELDLTSLSKLKQLERLRLVDVRVKSTTPLASLTELFDLAVQWSMGQEGTFDLAFVPALKKLRLLKITGSLVTARSFEAVAGANKLQVLNLAGVAVSDPSPIAQLTQLRSLTLPRVEAGNANPLAVVAKLTELEHLDAGWRNVTELSPLAKLSRLRSLRLASNPGLRDITQLRPLSELEQLDLAGTAVADVRVLSELKHLTRLDLQTTGVKSIVPLSNLTRLIDLKVRGKDISDASPLRGLIELKQLDLRDTSVRSLAPLRRLKKLRDVRVPLGMSSAEVDALMAALPQAYVHK